MKKNVITFAFKMAFFLMLTVVSTHVMAQSYNSPRSAVWDNANSRWLISNTAGGTILARSSSGTLTTFASGLTNPRGICIMGSNVFVCEDRNVKGFNLSTGASYCNVFISVSTQLWDLTSNGATLLYVTDNGANKIYTVNPSAGTFNTPAVTGLSSPSGILFEMSNNRLVVCSYRSNSPIEAISLSTWAVTTLATTSLSNLVGMSKDSQGNYYISSETDGNIYKYNSTFATGPTSVAGPYTTPGDIFIKTASDTLAIPLANSNQVVFVKLTPNEIKESPAGSPVVIYPNPVSDNFTFSYTLSRTSSVQAEIYELTGKKIRVIEQDVKSAGSYQQALSVSELNLPKGMYLFVLSIDGKRNTRKLIVE